MINVSGFLFQNEKMAAQARKEEEGVRFIKEKSSLKSQEAVYKLYTTLLQQKLFSTPVGLRFLMELHARLVDSGMNPEEIPPLHMEDYYPVCTSSEPVGESGRYKKAFYVALFCAIVFAVSIIGMFVIAEVSNNNINIINYEEKLIDKYEKWNNDLEAEEERLKDWEKELEEREAALDNE